MRIIDYDMGIKRKEVVSKRQAHRRKTWRDASARYYYAHHEKFLKHTHAN